MNKQEFERVARNVTPDKVTCEISNKATPINGKPFFQALIKYKGHEITRLYADVKGTRISIKGKNFYYDINRDADSLRNDLWDECYDKMKRLDAWDNKENKPIDGTQTSLFDESFRVGVPYNMLVEQVLNEANLNQIRSKQMNSTRDQDKRRNERSTQITSEYMGISKFGIFNFRTTSQTHPGYFWYQTIECPNIINLADIIDDPEEHIEVRDIDVLLKANDVMIFCDCLTKGNKILMADGTYKDISEIREGDYVITHNGNKKLVKAFISRPNDENILKISVGGKTIKCTKNHKFLVMNNGKEEWVLARDLTTDMKLLSLGGD